VRTSNKRMPATPEGRLRLGLRCQLFGQPIKFRISGPLEEGEGPEPGRHYDYIDPRDFPAAWQGWPLTVEVEAKAKELAIAGRRRWSDRTG
jgi:hypothetical protein